MKKPITSALVIAAACFGTWATLPSKSVLAADDNAMSRQADQELADALARGDKGAVAALLDENFLWVEADGTIHTKAQVVEDLAPLAIDNEGATDVRTLNLVGSAERVLGIHHNQRFAHMWVKRSSRWQAFVFLDIPIPAKRRENIAGARPPAGADRDCVNPCSTVPYKPENAAQEGALAAWFHLKNDEWLGYFLNMGYVYLEENLVVSPNKLHTCVWTSAHPIDKAPPIRRFPKSKEVACCKVVVH